MGFLPMHERVKVVAKAWSPSNYADFIPLVMGRIHPLNWSLDGETATTERITDLPRFATAPANFLVA
jgi:hypothetical protein